MRSFLVFIFFSISLHAENRIYQYYYKSVENLKELPSLNLSTFDPLSYQKYHGIINAQELILLRTWKCRGGKTRPDFFCPSPEMLLLKEQLLKIK